MTTRTKMNNNFNARITRRDGQTTPRLIFLNNCLKRVKARMVFGLQETADLLHSSEEFILFFGANSSGTRENNTARIILEDLVALEFNVIQQPPGDGGGALVVNFLGEALTFMISSLEILSVTADQMTSYVEYEVRVTLVGPQ